MPFGGKGIASHLVENYELRRWIFPLHTEPCLLPSLLCVEGKETDAQSLIAKAIGIEGPFQRHLLLTSGTWPLP